ncbi:MAG: hypothetical protein IKT43_00225 [Clostridia bacterium]|nr:hypothetical protein [Clostridia bacterium]
MNKTSFSVNIKRIGPVNLLLVALSLFLAFGLWLFVVSTESPTGQRAVANVPVKLVGTDTLSSTYGFSVLTGYDVTAEVTLRGKQSALNALSPEDVVAKVDLSDITAAGSYQKEIQVTPPSGMEVIRVSPENLVVEVDVEKTVSVPILKPDETYTLVEGVQFKRTLSTESISVKGPQTVVDKIYGIKCSVDLGNFTENVTKTVPFIFVDKDGNEITDRYLLPAQNTITIQYTLYKEKTVPLVLGITTLLEGEEVTQSVDPENVTVQGPPEKIDALTEIVAMRISTADITGQQTFAGFVTFPDGITCKTGAVKYTARAQLKSSSFTTVRLILSLTGENVDVTVPAGLKCEFASQSVSVDVRTTIKNRPRLDASVLEASLNLSSYTTPGTYTVELPVSVKTESQSLCYVVGTVTATVVLSQ